ncbi:MAG TPA: PRC-barrel domain-containing protein [Anaerolineae bacterium]|nr:PRC-barrel domain-containing protein [Anaerolineae bacterium]
MEIPIDAEVTCADGPGGDTTCVIVDPIDEQITHVVVQENHGEYTEHLVPIVQVAEATPRQIHLRCTQAELAALPNFVERQFKRGPMPFLGYPAERYLVWPYVLPDGDGMALLPTRHELIPDHELALHRDSWVMATDGHIGEVDEFIVAPTDGQITHLILRKGHFWGHQDVSIPVDQIDRIEADTIYLKLDKRAIGQLPPIALRRQAVNLADKGNGTT